MSLVPIPGSGLTSKQEPLFPVHVKLPYVHRCAQTEAHKHVTLRPLVFLFVLHFVKLMTSLPLVQSVLVCYLFNCNVGIMNGDSN